MPHVQGAGTLRSVVVVERGWRDVAGYAALADVYEWLKPDAKSSPEGSTAALADLVGPLETGARVLDCSCGTGQLAVGLAGLGLRVTATDASAAMVRRTAELAAEYDVSVEALQVPWSDLVHRLDGATFDLVLCVGNSLAHAEGASARSAALAAMARLLSPGGRLVLHSRNWEQVRAAGSRIDVGDRLIRRHDRNALVIYYWEIQDLWEEEHHLEIAVAQVAADGAVLTTSERLSFWPYRYDELLDDLRSLGLRLSTTTFDSEADGYAIVAERV